MKSGRAPSPLHDSFLSNFSRPYHYSAEEHDGFVDTTAAAAAAAAAMDSIGRELLRVKEITDVVNAASSPRCRSWIRSSLGSIPIDVANECDGDRTPFIRNLAGPILENGFFVVFFILFFKFYSSRLG
ncbi:hypothetical protein BHM03_00043150 [Ensete ventricosum]|nr:hypothetical protein BHM03_00043150 [Ensete ventricosum]